MALTCQFLKLKFVLSFWLGIWNIARIAIAAERNLLLLGHFKCQRFACLEYHQNKKTPSPIAIIIRPCRFSTSRNRGRGKCNQLGSYLSSPAQTWWWQWGQCDDWISIWLTRIWCTSLQSICYFKKITDQDLMYFLAIKFGSRITISELSFSL